MLLEPFPIQLFIVGTFYNTIIFCWNLLQYNCLLLKPFPIQLFVVGTFSNTIVYCWNLLQYNCLLLKPFTIQLFIVKSLSGIQLIIVKTIQLFIVKTFYNTIQLFIVKSFSGVAIQLFIVKTIYNKILYCWSLFQYNCLLLKAFTESKKCVSNSTSSPDNYTMKVNTAKQSTWDNMQETLQEEQIQHKIFRKNWRPFKRNIFKSSSCQQINFD